MNYERQLKVIGQLTHWCVAWPTNATRGPHMASDIFLLGQENHSIHNWNILAVEAEEVESHGCSSAKEQWCIKEYIGL